jgi:hypothetical protein
MKVFPAVLPGLKCSPAASLTPRAMKRQVHEIAGGRFGLEFRVYAAA